MDLGVLKVQRERREIKNQVCVPTGDEARDVAENRPTMLSRSQESSLIAMLRAEPRTEGDQQ